MNTASFPSHAAATDLVTVIGVAALVGVSFFGGCACCPCETQTQPVVLCELDAGPHDSGDDLTEEPFSADQSPEALARTTPCSRACASFALNGCPEATKKPGGLTCIENCRNITAKVGFSKFDPECVAKATSVEAVRACPAVKCNK